MYETCGAIVNRMNDEKLLDLIDLGDVPLLTCIPDDQALALSDVKGGSVLELPEDGILASGVRRALYAMGVD